MKNSCILVKDKIYCIEIEFNVRSLDELARKARIFAEVLLRCNNIDHDLIVKLASTTEYPLYYLAEKIEEKEKIITELFILADEAEKLADEIRRTDFNNVIEKVKELIEGDKITFDYKFYSLIPLKKFENSTAIGVYCYGFNDKRWGKTIRVLFGVYGY